MTRHGDDAPSATYASPPCFLHELDSAQTGMSRVAEPGPPSHIGHWRKTERARLIAERLAIPYERRRDHDASIVANLDGALGDVTGLIISVYWPVRGEPHLGRFIERAVTRGCRVALPAVIACGEPLVFRAWAPGEQLAPDAWNIPAPADDAEVVAPDVVIAPVVGFDARCYRLGYGDGFFDRTLAAMSSTPRVVGIGYHGAGIATIYPQRHDVPMDAIVTDEAVVSPEAGPTRAET